jgi:glycosyltransferase involved in cell wall biosynthesis
MNNPQKRVNIGMIGTLHTYKGVLDAIQAFASIATTFNGKLVLAGGISIEYQKRIDRMIKELGIAERVMLVYDYLTIQEVIDLHRILQVTLLPYQRITQSGAALTSLSLGVPVVGYDVGGMSEIVHQGSTGYLVSKGDIHGLGKAVMTIIQNQSIDYRKNCFDYSKTKTWLNVAQQTLDVYKSLMQTTMRKNK